ncbi:MAG: hypothetical protein V1689_03900 [Pseudomonadota bacterium]
MLDKTRNAVFGYLSMGGKNPLSQIHRAWRMVLFGLNILSTDESRLSRVFLPRVVRVDEIYDYEGSSYALRHYYPEGVRRPLPAVILYHGTTPKGEAHEAMNRLAANLASMGVRAYIPELPVLKKALVREETLVRMKCLYTLIAAKGEVREDRILVGGFSFAGGLLLKVCTDPQINPAAIICYGSYYDLETALRYFLTGCARFGEISLNITPHEYSRAVFFWNYLDQMTHDLNVDRLKECIYRFICDEHDEAWDLAGKLDERERAYANMAFNPDDQDGMNMVEQIIPRIRDELRSISPRYFLDRISAPVFLAHGVQDIMIPYTETLALATALERAGKEHYVYISSVYSHSDPEGHSVKGHLKEVKTLIGFLNRLFRYFA